MESASVRPEIVQLAAHPIRSDNYYTQDLLHVRNLLLTSIRVIYSTHICKTYHSRASYNEGTVSTYTRKPAQKLQQLSGHYVPSQDLEFLSDTSGVPDHRTQS